MSSTTDTLDKIQAQLSALESKAETAKEAKSTGTPWGWIVSLVIGAVVSIGAGLLIWKLNKKNKELAKLRTKVEQDEVTATQLAYEAKRIPHEETAKLLADRAEEIAVRVGIERTALEAEEERHASALVRVMAAKNWDQLDSLNMEGR